MIFYNANIRKLYPWYHTTNSENVLPFFRDIKRYNLATQHIIIALIPLYYNLLTTQFLFITHIKSPVIIPVTIYTKETEL